MNTLRIYAGLPRTHALGPFLRFGLWVQGCLKQCPGCITPEARSLDGGRVTPVDELADAILSVEDIEGITISGGEPFLQAEPLVGLVDQIREVRDLGVIVYSGYTLDEVIENDAVWNLIQRTDLLIDGPYIQELDEGRSLVGSSNQGIHLLTDRYSDQVKIHYETYCRKVEFHVGRDTLFMAGVPGREARKQWLNMKGAV